MKKGDLVRHKRFGFLAVVIKVNKSTANVMTSYRVPSSKFIDDVSISAYEVISEAKF